MGGMPETRWDYRGVEETDRGPVARYHSDQFYFHHSGMAHARPNGRHLSRICFELPGVGPRPAYVSVAGNGVNELEVFFHENKNILTHHPAEFRRLFQFPDGVNRRPIRDIEKTFTTYTSPFMPPKRPPHHALYVFDMQVRWAQDYLIRLIADRREEGNGRPVTIAYLPDVRDGDPMPVAELGITDSG